MKSRLRTYLRTIAVTQTIVLAAVISASCSKSEEQSLPCGKPDAPLRSPAAVDSWTPLTAAQGRKPDTAGYYFAKTYSFICAQGKFQADTDGTYLRFFSDGVVRQNTLLEETGFPQDSDIVMSNLSRDGFRTPAHITDGWGCCSRGEGTYSSATFTIDKFEPSHSFPVNRWEFTEVGEDTFTAVLSSDGSGGERYQFQFHPMPET